jgi:hypothetical protein
MKKILVSLSLLGLFLLPNTVLAANLSDNQFISILRIFGIPEKVVEIIQTRLFINSAPTVIYERVNYMPGNVFLSIPTDWKGVLEKIGISSQTNLVGPEVENLLTSPAYDNCSNSASASNSTSLVNLGGYQYCVLFQTNVVDNSNLATYTYIVKLADRYVKIEFKITYPVKDPSSSNAIPDQRLLNTKNLFDKIVTSAVFGTIASEPKIDGVMILWGSEYDPQLGARIYHGQPYVQVNTLGKVLAVTLNQCSGAPLSCKAIGMMNRIKINPSDLSTTWQVLIPESLSATNLYPEIFDDTGKRVSYKNVPQVDLGPVLYQPQ